MGEYSLLAYMLLGFISVYIFCSIVEFREWNHGICKKSGLPWKSFAVDSSGAIGYEDNLGHTIWISHSTVRLADYINNKQRK